MLWGMDMTWKRSQSRELLFLLRFSVSLSENFVSEKRFGIGFISEKKLQHRFDEFHPGKIVPVLVSEHKVSGKKSRFQSKFWVKG